jgi:hypothetical protein
MLNVSLAPLHSVLGLRMEGSCEYIENVVADSQQGVVILQLGVGRRANNSSP